MGIISDSLEDNSERIGQFLESVEAYLGAASPLESTPTVIRCPFCLRTFFSAEELFTHVQGAHAGQHIYLRLNGAVVRDVGWAESGINGCELGLLGFSSAAVRVITGGREKVVTVKSGANLLPHLPRGYEGHILVTVEPEAGRPKTFDIYNVSLPEFNRGDLDEVIVELNRAVDQAEEIPDLSRWIARLRAMADNELEHRYLNGHYEYVLGAALERFGRSGDSKQHLEDAFGLLLSFRTKLARTALRVLGLKTNCFGALEGCSTHSPFAPADAFFNARPGRGEKEFHRSTLTETGIYIDRFSALLLDALVSYFDPDDRQLPVILDALSRDPLSIDKNNEDKLRLLAARYHSESGSTESAATEYDLFKYHPLFGDEARSFLECLPNRSQKREQS